MSSITIRPRKEWGARSPRSTTALDLPVSEVWLHHSAGTSTKGKRPGEVAAILRSIQAQHMDDPDRRYSDIGYCFALDQAGRIWRARGLKVGAHTYGRNDDSIGVVWLGNFVNETPTAELVESTIDLLRYLRDRGALTDRFAFDGHGKAPLAATACPGSHAMDRVTYIRRRARR